MKKQVSASAVLCLLLFLITSPAFGGPYDVPSKIPDTGQAKCYDTEGNEISCAGTGQDGEYSINPMSFTRLDGSGNEVPDSASSWVMVKDEVTGLIWEVKQNKDDIKDYTNPHDADNTYTWYDSNTATNGGDEGCAADGTDTEDFIKALNDAGFGGHSDWRMPSRQELRTLIDYSIPYPGPSVDINYFPNTIASKYWPSTTYSSSTGHAWDIFFYSGKDGTCAKYVGSYVRAVRGGDPAGTPRFVDNGDSTITDTQTGLIWEQKTDDGGLRDKDNTYTLQQALAYCKDLRLNGSTDWRLPTIKELLSLTDLRRPDPAIDSMFENYVVQSYYWSSTTNAANTHKAWSVNFFAGHDSYKNKSDNQCVRAVRSGNGCSLDDLADAAQCLKIVAGIESEAGKADINNDAAIGLQEAIHSLQSAAELH